MPGLIKTQKPLKQKHILRVSELESEGNGGERRNLCHNPGRQGHLSLPVLTLCRRHRPRSGARRLICARKACLLLQSARAISQSPNYLPQNLKPSRIPRLPYCAFQQAPPLRFPRHSRCPCGSILRSTEFQVSSPRIRTH